jgi:hypothetical protein
VLFLETCSGFKLDRSLLGLLWIWFIYHKPHQIMTVQLKRVIFIEKRLSLNVEENELMASLCYFQKHVAALNWIDPT